MPKRLKPELIELFLTQLENPNRTLENFLHNKHYISVQPESFVEHFQLLLQKTPNIASTKKEFWISSFLGSILILPHTKLMQEIGIEKIYIRAVERPAHPLETIKVFFKAKIDGKSKLILRTITSTHDLGKTALYTDNELKEIIEKLKIRLNNIDSYEIDGKILHIGKYKDDQLDFDYKELKLSKPVIFPLKRVTNNEHLKLKTWEILTQEEVKGENRKSLKERFKEVIKLDSAQSNDIFYEVSEKGVEYNFVELLNGITNENVELVKINTKKFFEAIIEIYRVTIIDFMSYKFKKSEAFYQGFTYGVLLLNFKYQNDLDCYIEQNSGRGRLDLTVSSPKGKRGDKVVSTILVIVEFKKNNDVSKAIEQIKEKYVSTLPNIRTDIKEIVMVGVNFDMPDDKQLEIEISQVIQPKVFFIQRLLDACVGENGQLKNGDTNNTIDNTVNEEFKYLYCSTRTEESLDKVILGQALVHIETTYTVNKIFSNYRNNRDQITIFVFNINDGQLGIILNIIQGSQQQDAQDNTGLYIAQEYKIKEAIRINIKINPQQKKFEDYCKKIEIQRLNSEDIAKAKPSIWYKGKKNIGDINIDNFIQEVYCDSIDEAGDQSPLSESPSPSKKAKMQVEISRLLEPIFYFKSFINNEADFKAIMHGVFMSRKIANNIYITTSTEISLGTGNADLVLKATKKQGTMVMELKPIIMELKYGTKIEQELKQANDQLGEYIQNIKVFSNQREALALAIVCNKNSTNPQDFIRYSSSLENSYYTTEECTSPEKASAKLVKSRLPSTSKNKINTDNSVEKDLHLLNEISKEEKAYVNNNIVPHGDKIKEDNIFLNGENVDL